MQASDNGNNNGSNIIVEDAGYGQPQSPLYVTPETRVHPNDGNSGSADVNTFGNGDRPFTGSPVTYQNHGDSDDGFRTRTFHVNGHEWLQVENPDRTWGQPVKVTLPTRQMSAHDMTHAIEHGIFTAFERLAAAEGERQESGTNVSGDTRGPVSAGRRQRRSTRSTEKFTRKSRTRK